MKHFALSITLGLICAAPAVWGQAEVMRFSLQEAEDYAAKNSYEVRDADYELAKARQTIRETAAQGYPQISTGFEYSHNAQIQEQPIPAIIADPSADPDDFITVAFGVAHQNRANVNLNQLIVDASYFVALQATRVFKETKRLERETAEIQARKNAAQAYYGVLIADRSVEIIEENLENTQKNLRETRKLYESGFVEQQDADQLELLVNNLQNNLQNARRQSALARQLFKFNLGIPLTKEIALSDELENVLLPGEMASTLATKDFDHEDHIAFRAVLSQERGAELQVSNQKASYYPTLSGFATHSQSRFANEFDQAFNFQNDLIPATTIGLGLNWQLFTGFARSARVQTAKIDLDRAQMAKESTANRLRLEYEQAISDFNYALENYRNKKQNLELSRRIKDRTTKKYQEGVNSSLELTQAQNQFLDTQNDYLNSMQQLLNAKEELENALGQ